MSKRDIAKQNEYISKTYDRINLVVKKGEREKIRQFASKTGETLNGFINRLIRNAMENG